MGSTMGDEEFNALSKRFGCTLTTDRLRNIKVKRLFSGGEDERPAKRIKKGGWSPDVIALIHDRIHELHVIPGRHVFLTQRDWLKRDLDWLIQNCGWLFALIRQEEEELIGKIKKVIADMKTFRSNFLGVTNPVSLLAQNWTDGFTILLSHLHDVFPSDVRDVIVFGEIYERVYHLERHWTKMRNTIREVNDGEGLADIRKILEEVGKSVTVKDWNIRESVIELD